MRRVSQTEAIFEYELIFGVTGQESFQFARDADYEQMIYPAYPTTTKLGVPIRGPDGNSKGKNWVIFGEQGEKATIQIKVLDAVITVTVKSAGDGTGLSWQSVVGKARHKPCIAGTWLGDAVFEEMKPVDTSLDVFVGKFIMSDRGFELFQVCFDEDLERAYYPEVEGHACGEVFVLGPSAGQDKNFRVEGLPGVPFEIKLDLKATDRRRIVTWRPILEEGMPFFPYVNALYDE